MSRSRIFGVCAALVLVSFSQGCGGSSAIEEDETGDLAEKEEDTQTTPDCGDFEHPLGALCVRTGPLIANQKISCVARNGELWCWGGRRWRSEPIRTEAEFEAAHLTAPEIFDVQATGIDEGRIGTRSGLLCSRERAHGIACIKTADSGTGDSGTWSARTEFKSLKWRMLEQEPEELVTGSLNDLCVLADQVYCEGRASGIEGVPNVRIRTDMFGVCVDSGEEIACNLERHPSHGNREPIAHFERMVPFDLTLLPVVVDFGNSKPKKGRPVLTTSVYDYPPRILCGSPEEQPTVIRCHVVPYPRLQRANPTFTVLRESETEVRDLQLGRASGCLVDEAGGVECWKLDSEQLEAQSADYAPKAKEMPLPASAVWIDVGLDHTCALLEDDSVWCWGKNDVGQLGDGTLIDSAEPVQAKFPEEK